MSAFQSTWHLQTNFTAKRLVSEDIAEKVKRLKNGVNNHQQILFYYQTEHDFWDIAYLSH